MYIYLYIYHCFASKLVHFTFDIFSARLDLFLARDTARRAYDVTHKKNVFFSRNVRVQGALQLLINRYS